VRTADPDADLEAALAEWRRYRRRRRVADIHPIDALYQVYVTALVGAVILFGLAALVGDGRLGAAGMRDVAVHGADWLGVVTAAVVAIGLRSGARGGPLALEAADVRHVLLAPVDRTAALRGPAVRQLRFLVFAASLVGIQAGLLAAGRLDHHAGLWMAAGAAYAVATVVLAYGVALCASTLRVPSPVATGLGVLLIGWASADGVGLVAHSPATAWGSLAVAPVTVAWTGALAVVASLAVAVIGFARVGDTPLEAAERRSSLVGQIRFAATLQDVRTVMVLRRQLAMELPRLAPYVRLRTHGVGRFPVWARGLRGVLRWPSARVGRLTLLGVVAGLALRGAWDGTTALVAVGGLALYIGALDAVEGLAAEVDRPTRSRTLPIEPGELHVRHLPVAVAVMVLTAAVAAVAGVVAGPSLEAAAVAAVCVLPAALGSVAGAATSVLSGGPDDGAWSLAAPEVAGVRLVVRTAWPIVLSIGGTLPILAARAASDAGSDPVAGAAAAGLAVAVAFSAVAAWVRKRDALQAAWAAATDPAAHRRLSAAREEALSDAR
jgi:hypothetical protein